MKETIYYVTGATGWLGHQIVLELLNRKKKVVAFVVPNDRFKSLLDNLDDVTIVEGDIVNPQDCVRFLDTNRTDAIQKVIHCAGIVSVSSKTATLAHKVNVIGTQNIADVSLEFGVDRFIYVSSTHALKDDPKASSIKESFNWEDDPKRGHYSYTKAKASKYVHDLASKGLNSIIIHPTAIIGPDDYGCGYMTLMFKSFLANKLPASVKGAAYDLVDVRDVAHLVISASDNGIAGENYIASGHKLTITSILNEIAKQANRKPIKHELSLGFVKFVAPLYELFCRITKQTALYTKSSLNAVESNSNFDNTKAKARLNFCPRSAQESIKDTIDFVIKQYPQCKKR